MTTIMPHIQGDEGDSQGEPEEEGYAAWSKDELQAELESRGLPKTGNKPELIEALEADDAS